MQRLIAIILLTCFSILLVQTAYAGLITDTKKQEINNNTSQAAQSGETAYDNRTLDDYIVALIRLVLSVLGAIFVVLIFVAGNNWMQAAGNEEKVKKAQDTIQNLLIGLCILLIGYFLASGLGGLLSSILLAK